MKRTSCRIAASLCAMALTSILSGCGGGGSPAGGGSVAVTSAPTPSPTPMPTPTPTASSAFVGAVYVGTNNFGPSGNWVVGFGRRSDGTLVPLDAYETGSSGRSGVSKLSPLIAEDSLLAVDNKFLLVVNAGSNNVTSFKINSDFSLTRVDVEDSGGTSPVSLAYRNGIVYVANADEDGVFTGPPNQSGNITAIRIDAATGQLTRIGGFSPSLGARPADLEVTPDGGYLAISALNAGAPQLPQPTAAEVSTFKIHADGTLAKTPSGTGMSTQLNNPQGRNLPNAIGIEVIAIKGRQFLVAAESRTASSTGVPGTFTTLQTGSASSWEIGADGTLQPRTQDLLLGPSLTSGPMQAGFIAYNYGYGFMSIASSSGSAITSINIRDDGTLTPVPNDGYQIQGKPADAGSATPLANADGFIDLAFDPDDNFLYQLVGLKGRIDRYDIVFSYELGQKLTTGLLPLDNLQGLAVVGPAAS